LSEAGAASIRKAHAVPRLTPENIEANLALVELVKEIATEKKRPERSSPWHGSLRKSRGSRPFREPRKPAGLRKTSEWHRWNSPKPTFRKSKRPCQASKFMASVTRRNSRSSSEHRSHHKPFEHLDMQGTIVKPTF